MSEEHMALGDFRGIGKGRTIKPIHQTALDKIMDLEKQIEDELAKQSKDDYARFDGKALGYLPNMELTEKILTEYVLAKDFGENSGTYTGAMLYLITCRNRLRNRRTELYINGHGKEAPWLFKFAHGFDILILDDFQGDKIGGYIGSSSWFGAYVNMNTRGTPGATSGLLAGTIILSNITSAELFGIFDSTVDQIILHDLHLYSLGQSLRVGRLIEIGKQMDNPEEIEIKQYRYYEKCCAQMEELLSDVPGQRKLDIVRGMHEARYRLNE